MFNLWYSIYRNIFKNLICHSPWPFLFYILHNSFNSIHTHTNKTYIDILFEKFYSGLICHFNILFQSWYTKSFISNYKIVDILQQWFITTGLDGVLIQTSSDLTLGVTPLDVRCSPANSELIMYVNSFTLHRNGTPVAKVTYNRAAQNTNLIVLDVTNNRGR